MENVCLSSQYIFFPLSNSNNQYTNSNMAPTLCNMLHTTFSSTPQTNTST